MSFNTNDKFNTLSGTLLQATTISASAISVSTIAAAGANTQVQFNDSGSFGATGSFTYDKSLDKLTVTNIQGSSLSVIGQITASVGISASIGKFDALTASNSLVANTTTVGNYVQLLPIINPNIPSNTTASYIYTSGSTNDMYFTQYGGGYTNTTRLRWLEGMLTTGLLHGGVLSTATGSTTFSITSGSGIIVSYNASLETDPYPTINYVSWPATVSQSLTYVTSSLTTYIGINPSGTIIQQTSPFTLSADSDFITIGRVLHQSGSVTNGVTTQPIVSYGTNHWQDDFSRAFGPLKVSGHILSPSGSTLGLTKTAGDSYVIGKNYTTDPNNPNNVTSNTDTAVTVSKIYRAYVSGSTLRLDTGVANAGYTTIDPAQYNNNGTLASVGASQASIQRVYWYPNSVSRAFTVYYGSDTYTDPFGSTNALDVAQQNIASEPFVEGENTAGAAILVGYILVLGSATNLSNTAQARFIQAGISRGAGAGGGGGVVAGATTPGGLDTYVQFNDGGSTFGGDAGLTYNKTTNSLTIDGNLTVNGSYITASAAQFTTLTASLLSASSTIRAGGAITGSGISSSAELLIGSTSTFAGTATFNGNVVLGDTLSDIVTSNAQITASNGISGSTLQFTTITGSTITSSNFVGNGQNINNITASNINNFTNDVRTQFTPGTNITIVGGVISSTAGGGIPGGADTQVQFNSGSTFSGSSNLIYDYTNNILSGTTAKFTTISGSTISSSNFVGNGQNINNITASNINNFTNDVRAQFSAGTGIIINAGVISASNVPNTSLQNSAVALGTTVVSLGATGSTIQGLTALTSSNATGTTAQFTTLSGSQITASSTLQVGGATTIGGNLNVNGGQTTVQSFTASAGISSSAGLIVGGSTRILGNLTLDNNLIVSGNTTLGNASTDIVTSNAQITASNGLSASVIDVTDKATTRSNLGLAIGTNVQAYDATLAAIAGVSTNSDRYIYFTGVDTATFATITTLGRDIVDSSTTASAQSTLGLTVGTDVLAYDATLQAIANAPNPIADRYYYFTGVTTAVTGTITSFGRDLLADNNDSDGRATLGLGTISTQDSNNVIITGGSINGTQIGNTSQAAGKFTSLSASSIVNFASTLSVEQKATFFNDVVVSGSNIILSSETPNITTTSSAGRITIGTGSTDSLIEIATPGGSTYRGIRILSGSTEKWFAGVDNSNDYVLRTDGNDRFQFFEEGRLQIIQTTNTNTSGLYFNSGTVDWYVYVNSTNDLYFQYEAGANGGFISDTVVASQMNFTGQHRNMPDPSEEVDLFLEENEGLIVTSAGTYNNVTAQPNNKPTINESLPKIKLSNARNQKSVFGVIAEFEDPEKETREWGYGAFRTYMTKQDLEDNRIIVNAVGEGAIWVCNINGNLENGDYITTCEIPGHGMKQDDDLLHNYTVAKITQDCSFELDNPNYDCVEFEFSGSTYRKAFVGCTYHCG